MNQVLDTIKSRRSVRTYKKEQIPEETLTQILEAGIYAPTAHNEQPWHFTVIQDPSLLMEINDKARAAMKESTMEWVRNTASNPNFQITYDAPTLIIVSGKSDGLAWRVDCAAAIENMLIAAESLGVGSVWLGLARYYFENPENAKKLNIPDGYEPFYGVAFGYKAGEKKLPAPKRNMAVINYIR